MMRRSNSWHSLSISSFCKWFVSLSGIACNNHRKKKV
jgi:hypothetical protein